MLKLAGVDTAVQRAGVEGAAVERGWTVAYGIHPEPPKGRHLRLRVEARDRGDLQQLIERADMPEGVTVAEAWEYRPGALGWRPLHGSR